MLYIIKTTSHSQILFYFIIQVSIIDNCINVNYGLTVGPNNFEPRFRLRAWNWCFRLVSMLLYEHICFLNMQGLVDNEYRFVIECKLRIYL